jgi:hypothetical protein
LVKDPTFDKSDLCQKNKMKKTKIFSFVVVCLFGLSFVNVASAMTNKEVQLKVDNIQRQVELLKQIIQLQNEIELQPVSVTLALTSPQEAGLLSKLSGAKIADFVFTGKGTVKLLTFHQSGYSDQNALTAIYLYDGKTRLTDGYTFNSNGNIEMNDLNIIVDGSKVISVKVDVAADAAETQTNVVISLTSFTTKSSSLRVNRSVSISSGTFWFVQGELATAEITKSTSERSWGKYPIVWGNDLTIGTRDVLFEGITFKMYGSAPTTVLSNIHLFVDGSVVGKHGTVDPINNITFDVSTSPVRLDAGLHVIEIRANIARLKVGENFLVKIGDIDLVDPVYMVDIGLNKKEQQLICFLQGPACAL